MPSFTQMIPNLQQVAPVIEVTLMPSSLYLNQMKISPSAPRYVRLSAMTDTSATGTAVKG